MKKNVLRLLGLMLISFCILNLSCSDDHSSNGGGESPINPIKPDFTKKTSMNVAGFIVDENNQILKGVKVHAGDSTVTTNEFGYFEVNNVALVEDHSFVVAEKEGYFNTTRTWMGQKGGTYEIYIKMLPKTIAGNFSSKEGGTVTSDSGVSLTFPIDAVTKSDGTPYTGNVNVAIQWLDAVSDDFERTMPGDLSAINASGNTATLVSYGMAAVELRGDGNELLQVGDDKKVKMVTPIASKLQSSAKDSIPLWYFDETKGMWIEEGTAKKEGNTFVGEVSHFSWWNCDYAFESIVVEGWFINKKTSESIGSTVFTVKFDEYECRYFCDANGYFRFRMPKETTGAIYVGDCSLVATSFSGSTEDINLNKIELNVYVTTIEGTIDVPCVSDAVVRGEMVLYSNYGVIIKQLRITDGNYKFTLYSICEDFNNNYTLLLSSYFELYEQTITGYTITEITMSSSGEYYKPITIDCAGWMDVVINGSVTKCGDINKPYEGGYVEFNSYKASIVDGSYKLKVPMKDNFEGQLKLFDNDGNLVETKNITLLNNHSLVYNFDTYDKINITGTAVDCNNNPITNGSVSIDSPIKKQSIIKNGVYSISDIYACEDMEATITIRDYDNAQETTQKINLKIGNNVIPSIKVCGSAIESSYLNYEIDGVKTVVNANQIFGLMQQGLFFLSEGDSVSEGDEGANMIIVWKNKDKPNEVGTYPIEVGWVSEERTGNGCVKCNILEITGSVTLTEVIYSENLSESIKMKGTFEGVAKDESGKEREIKGNFLHFGKNSFSLFF